MPITTKTSRKLNQNTSEFKRATKRGADFIPESIKQRKISDLLFVPEVADIEFDIPSWKEIAKSMSDNLS